jgi:hypothetical protein
MSVPSVEKSSLTRNRTLTADFVVVGGGLAGVCAAISAARNGARVVLVQDRSVLGGNASSEIRMHVVGADCHGTRPGARESGLLEELRLEDAARNPQRSYAQWDLLLYDKVVAEPNITLLLDTDCVGCDTELREGRRRIIAVRAVRNSTEETFVLRAPFFADCSGDGRLGAEAGADFTVGRESRSMHGESLAPEQADACTLGSSILFTARRHESVQPYSAPRWTRKFQRSDFARRPIRSFEYGYWWFEWGGHLDTLRDNAAIRHELLRIALGVWDYIKNSGDYPDSANWALDWVGAVPGKRESRRFLGPHVLTQQDVQSGRIFPDQVAYGGWWLDLHPPLGIDAPDEDPCVQHPLPHLFTLPLGCLHSRNVCNLFFAGRNLSATHVAFASTRVMGTCAVAGQAVGTAAAVAARVGGEEIGAVFRDAAHLKALQQTLLKQDAFLPTLRNEDADDLARRAKVAASSATVTGAAEQVIDGYTRELVAHLGPWADGARHGWESAALPAWIELTWPRPVAVTEIHLTFDSGFQRELTLSASDATTRHTVRGPQPEIVRDYEVWLDDTRIATVAGNIQRKVIHRLPAPIAGGRLRVVALATHGAPTARVFEVRVYAQS